MKRAMWMLAVAVLAAGSAAWAADAPAAEALDGALGPTKPALDPGAANKHDNNDLINDLTNGKKTEPAQVDPKKMVGDFLDHTKGAADNMKLNLDAGADTQDHQRRALAAMDSLIEYVKKQEQQQQSQSQSQSQSQAQQKQKNPGQPQDGQGQPGEHQDGGTSAAQNSQLPGGGVNPFKSNGDLINKDPKEWGTLPAKARDQILNSLQDGALKNYQEKIRKYYEALAEIGRSK